MFCPEFVYRYVLYVKTVSMSRGKTTTWVALDSHRPLTHVPLHILSSIIFLGIYRKKKFSDHNCYVFRDKVTRSCFFDHDTQEVGAPSSFAWDQKGYDANKTGYLNGGLCICVYTTTSPLFRSESFSRREDHLLKPNGIIFLECINVARIQTDITPIYVYIFPFPNRWKR